MYFGISNCESIKKVQLKGQKTILIECLSASEYLNMEPIPNIDEYSAILRLYVKDTDYFDLENAKMLNDFIVNNDFDEVIAYCALGISRSPAIMICVAKILQSQLMETTIKENYKFYNKYIVTEFEKHPYQYKNIIDNDFVLREFSKKGKRRVKIPSIIID